MNWRPEGWRNPYAETVYLGQEQDEEVHVKTPCTNKEIVAYEAGADAMLKAVCEEIEKVENPYGKAKQEYVNGIDVFTLDFHSYGIWNNCRQKLLALFREKGE